MTVRRTFTLIELLVVVAIIAVLISILLPAITMARHQARMTVCASNVRQIMVASLNYAQAESECLPPNAASSQGEMDSGWFGINGFYGPAILVKERLVSPQVLYSQEDSSFNPALWPTPYTHPYHVGYSYTFREPDVYFQHVNPSISYYMLPYKRDQVDAFVSDKFTGNHIFSFHGKKGTANVANEAWDGNGEGWHVAFVDGHAVFKKNDPFVYRWGSSVGAAAGWSNRYLNWTYWDTRP